VGEDKPLTLVEAWNGTKWSIITSPNPNTSGEDTLNGVSCTSSTNCVAVGWYYNGLNRTLVEAWNGADWSTMPSANRSKAFNVLTGVTCTSSTNCVAVGFDTTSSSTLIEAGSVPPPVITKFNPHSGPMGMTVTIQGKNLADVTSISFNGQSAVIKTDTGSKVTTKVPSGATTGKISVSTAGGTTRTAASFKVT